MGRFWVCLIMVWVGGVLSGCVFVTKHEEYRRADFTKQALVGKRVAVMPPVVREGVPAGVVAVDRLYDQMLMKHVKGVQANPWRFAHEALEAAALSDAYRELVQQTPPLEYHATSQWSGIVAVMRGSGADYVMVPRLVHTYQREEEVTHEEVHEERSKRKNGKVKVETYTTWWTEVNHYTVVRMELSVFDAQSGEVLWWLDASDETEREEVGFGGARAVRGELDLWGSPRLPEGEPLRAERIAWERGEPLPVALYREDPLVAIALDHLFRGMIDSLPAKAEEGEGNEK